jgi:hypothetical protein
MLPTPLLHLRPALQPMDTQFALLQLWAAAEQQQAVANRAAEAAAEVEEGMEQVGGWRATGGGLHGSQGWALALYFT